MTNSGAVNPKPVVDRLVRENFGLVYTVAYKCLRPGLELDELVAEGLVGLVIAAQKYRTDKGARFSTYGALWIRALIFESIIRNAGPVRIGTTRTARNAFFGLAKVAKQLVDDGLEATDELLASRTGADVSAVQIVRAYFHRSHVALDAMIDTGEGYVGRQMQDLRASAEDELLDDEARRERQAILDAGLAVLDRRELVIIRARHLRERRATLQEIGDMLHISRERVRQLEKRALKKMRATRGGGGREQ